MPVDSAEPSPDAAEQPAWAAGSPAAAAGNAIEIWVSVSGISPEDFSLLATVPDGAFYELATPLIPGQLYIYKARRYDASQAAYSAFCPLVFARGPWPGALSFPGGFMSFTTQENPTTQVGFNSKIGIGMEPGAGQLSLAARLLNRVSGSLLSDLSLIEQMAIRNHPGSPGVVRGISKVGGGLVLEVTPESCDEILCAYFGAPATTGAAGPAALALAPVATVVGAAGTTALTYSVIARNAQGDSLASPVVTVNTANAALSAANYVQLTWNAVPYATSYVVLKGTNILGIAGGLSLQDTGQATSGVYAAPAASAGNIQTWKNGLSMLPVSLLEQRGASVFGFGGCNGNKLSISWDKTQSTPFQMTAEMMALYEILGYTQAQTGLNTAGFDPLGDYGVAPSTVAYFAGALADCQSYKADLDNNLGEKHTLSGFIGPNGFFKQDNKGHSFSATLYFSTEAEYQRYFGQLPGTPVGPYGVQRAINYFPVLIVTTAPANAAGIVNQFILSLPYCSYQKVGAPIKDKGAIMQDVELKAYIDPVTGTDVVIQVVNSRSNSNIISPQGLVTPVPSNAQFPWVN